MFEHGNIFEHDYITHLHAIFAHRLLEEINRLSQYFKNIGSNVEIIMPLPLDNFKSNVIYIEIKGYRSVIYQFIKHEFDRNCHNKYLEKVLDDKIMVEELKEEEGYQN